MAYLTQYYYALDNWAVILGNRYIFHVRDVLVPMGGSGDTSYGWAQLWLYLLLAATGCLIWSIADRRRAQYRIADYWMRNMVRYFIAMTALWYGIWKLYANQMPFPNQSELATPLGDFLPMRLSWMFVGYSAPYQIFSGVMETLIGQPQITPPNSGYGAFSPEIDVFLKEHLFADIFGRDILSYTDREIATITALVNLDGVEPMMKGHLSIALNLGVTEAQLQHLLAIVETNTGKVEADNGRKVLLEVMELRKK